MSFIKFTEEKTDKIFWPYVIGIIIGLCMFIIIIIMSFKYFNCMQKFKKCMQKFKNPYFDPDPVIQALYILDNKLNIKS